MASATAWRALEDCKAEGLCRAIGVSNYEARHLDEMADYAREMPEWNQFECHVAFRQKGWGALAAEATVPTPHYHLKHPEQSAGSWNPQAALLASRSSDAKSPPIPCPFRAVVAREMSPPRLVAASQRRRQHAPSSSQGCACLILLLLRIPERAVVAITVVGGGLEK